MIVLRGIRFESPCKHHMAPILEPTRQQVGPPTA